MMGQGIIFTVEQTKVPFKPRASNAFFYSKGVRSNEACTGGPLPHLGARARGGGHGDEGSAALGQRLGATHDFEEIVQVRVVASVA